MVLVTLNISLSKGEVTDSQLTGTGPVHVVSLSKGEVTDSQLLGYVTAVEYKSIKGRGD